MFVVFDIETTGFSTSSDDIVEFAYLLFDDNNNYVRGEQLYFYYEGMTWSEEAYRIHQIPLSFLKEHKDNFKANLAKMYSVLNYNNIIGHNSDSFDSVFVNNWLTRMGIDTLTFGLKFDTMKIYKPLTKRPRIKLTKLVDYINVTPEHIIRMMDVWFPHNSHKHDAHAHDAAYDTTATCLLALRALDMGLLDVNKTTTQTQRELPSTDGLYAQGTVTEAPIFIPLAEYEGGTVEYQNYCKTEELMKLKQIIEEDDMKVRRHTSCVFPKVFYRVDNSDVYRADIGEISFEFATDGTYDVLTLVAPYGRLDCSNMDLFKVIEDLKGGNN